MKTLLQISLFAAIVGAGGLGRAESAGWTESGVLEYSYAYARSWLGYRMRRDGWVCRIGFTAGRNGEQEHSVWIRGPRKMQLMIWIIDSNRTGYAKGEIGAAADKHK